MSMPNLSFSPCPCSVSPFVAAVEFHPSRNNEKHWLQRSDQADDSQIRKSAGATGSTQTYRSTIYRHALFLSFVSRAARGMPIISLCPICAMDMKSQFIFTAPYGRFHSVLDNHYTNKKVTSFTQLCNFMINITFDNLFNHEVIHFLDLDFKGRTRSRAG